MLSASEILDIRSLVHGCVQKGRIQPAKRSPEAILASIWNHKSYLKRRQRFYSQGLTVEGKPRKRPPGVLSTKPHAVYMRKWRKQKENQTDTCKS